MPKSRLNTKIGLPTTTHQPPQQTFLPEGVVIRFEIFHGVLTHKEE
jgi:hypothetical protein